MHIQTFNQCSFTATQAWQTVGQQYVSGQDYKLLEELARVE